MIDLHIADGIAEVVLNAPEKMNALDAEALGELSRVYENAAHSVSTGEVRALLLRGEGRGFCAGRDISGVVPADDDVQGYLGGLVEPLVRQMADFPAPTNPYSPALLSPMCRDITLGFHGTGPVARCGCANRLGSARKQQASPVSDW